MLTFFKVDFMNFSKNISPPGTLFVDIPARGYCPKHLNPFEQAEMNRDNIRKVSTIKSEEMADKMLKKNREKNNKSEKKELLRDMTADEQALEMLKKYAP